MKYTSLCLLAGLLFLLSCQKSVDPKEPNGIKLNQVVQIDANRSYTITRINDSRCPIGEGIPCIWQGVAEVTVRLNQSNQTDTVKVATLDVFDGLYQRKRTITINGSTWTVELMDVLPCPVWPAPKIYNPVVQLKVSVQ